jgi:hypothetical protein
VTQKTTDEIRTLLNNTKLDFETGEFGLLVVRVLS